MTYLDFPRFHFAGSFFADPSTINNDEANFKSKDEPFDRSEYWKPGPLGQWNPEGRHAFRFEGVRITSALQTDGSVAAATDPVLSCKFETGRRGRLVDLDPDQQLVSMIFGLNLALVGDSTDRVDVKGDLEPVPFTDIWRRGMLGTGDEAASAAYQSTITVRSWGDVSASDFLQQLQEAASDDILSIKFNLDGYSMRRVIDGTVNARFRMGRVVGTVGRGAPEEPKHFVVGRQFGNEVHQLGSAFPSFRPVSGVNYFPGVVDVAGETIRVDLGNALPASSAGGPVADIGDLSVGCRSKDGSIVEIDTIDYSPAGWYEDTAGIATVPRDRMLTETEKQLIETSPLCLVARLDGQRRIVSEEVDAHVRADAFVARLNPGDSCVVHFRASRFGRPASNARINVSFSPPGNSDARENFPVHGLDFPSHVDCDADGVAEVTMVASDPGNPRVFYTSDRPRVNVDGQFYRVRYELDDHAQPNPSNFLSILVWNTFVADEPPTWHGSMRQVFKQYGDLYPVMTNSVDLDLADYEQVVEEREAIRAVIELPIEDPGYMPVTRDLSRSRRDAMVRWLTELGADGKPLLGVAPALDEVAAAQPEEVPAPHEDADFELGGKTLAGRRTTIARP